MGNFSRRGDVAIMKRNRRGTAVCGFASRPHAQTEGRLVPKLRLFRHRGHIAAVVIAALLGMTVTTAGLGEQSLPTAQAGPYIPCDQWQQMHPGWPCVDVPEPPTPPPGVPSAPPPLPAPVMPGQPPNNGGAGSQAGALTPPPVAPGNGTPIVPVPGAVVGPQQPNVEPPKQNPLPRRESDPATGGDSSSGRPTESGPTPTAVPIAPTQSTVPTQTPSPGSIRDQLPVRPVSRCGEERAWSFSQGCHDLYTYKVLVHSTQPNYTPPGTSPYDTCSAASDGIVCTVTRSTTISRTVTKTGQLGVDATVGAIKASGQVSKSVAETESLTIGESGGKAPSIPMKAGETLSAYPTYTLVRYEVQRYDAKTGDYVSTEQKQALFPEGSTYRVGPTGAPNGFPDPPPEILPVAPNPITPHPAGGN